MNKDRWNQLISRAVIWTASANIIIYILSGRVSSADIGLADESIYLGNGSNPLNFFLQDGFLYFLYYKLLHLIYSDPVTVYYVNTVLANVILFAALTLPFEAVSRGMYASVVTVLLTALLAVNPYLFPVWPFVTKIAALIIMLPVILKGWFRLSPRTLRLAGVFSLFAVQYVRPEYYFAFFIYSAVILVTEAADYLKLRKSAENKKSFILPFVTVLFLSAVSLTYSVISGERSLVAFSQHYALRLSSQQELKINPVTDHEVLLKEHFGEVKSVSGVIAADPEKFLGHVYSNFRFFRSNALPALSIPEYAVILWILGSGISFFINYRKKRQILSGNYDLIIYLAVLVLPPAAGILIVYPRVHYLVLLAPVVYYIFFRGTELMNEKIQPLMYLVIFFLAADGTRSLLENLRFQRPHLSECSNYNLIKHLNSSRRLPLSKVVLNEGGELCMYLSSPCKDAVHYRKNSEWLVYAANENINVVILNEKLIKASRFIHDRDFQKFAENPAGYGFKKDESHECKQTEILIKSGKE